VSLVEQLRAGDLLLLSTDTLPGLHALATVPGAADRLRARKGSAPGRPFLLLFASADDALRAGHPWLPGDVALLRRAWPGALTALLVPAPETPLDWTESGRSLAARVPACAALRELIAAVGGPLFSTSANPAGCDPAADLAAASSYFPDLEARDLGGPGDRVASTIVDLVGAQARIVRQGAVDWPPGTGSP
jgi:L-threonylcarbamoyladenylate synthase